MQPTLALIASILPIFAAASPLSVRAGGPIGQPIPSNCTVINPLPHAKCGTANVHGYMPVSNTTVLYSAYYDPVGTAAEAAKECFEQCQGYGYPGTCKAGMLAQNVPTPKGYYGSTGGSLMTACLLFSDYLNPLQFTAAPSGQYVNATAANIYCPA